MNATDLTASSARPLDALSCCANVFLIGVGHVGAAFLEALANHAIDDIRLVGIANSTRSAFRGGGIAPAFASNCLSDATNGSHPATFAEPLVANADAAPVIVDATASEEIAAWHARWLSQGIHVVTANKLAAASGWITATHRRRARYGDSATVGAGLPILDTIRRLRAGGDDIRRIEALLSGSLTSILHAIQNGRPFSTALKQAGDAGYTEPDPRNDLAGADVARKLAIIAEAAGIATSTPVPEPALPTELTRGNHDDFQRRLPKLDAHWRKIAGEAHAQNRVLRYVARLSANGKHYVGLDTVPTRSLLYQAEGTENIVVIESRAYHREPLVIRGPGAGPGVTARGMLADIAAVLAR